MAREGRERTGDREVRAQGNKARLSEMTLRLRSLVSCDIRAAVMEKCVPIITLVHPVSLFVAVIIYLLSIRQRASLSSLCPCT